ILRFAPAAQTAEIDPNRRRACIIAIQGDQAKAGFLPEARRSPIAMKSYSRRRSRPPCGALAKRPRQGARTASRDPDLRLSPISSTRQRRASSLLTLNPFFPEDKHRGRE